MNPDTPIDEAYVLSAARAAGLVIDPTHVPGVTATFARIAAIAHPLNTLELDASDELAPLWTP